MKNIVLYLAGWGLLLGSAGCLAPPARLTQAPLRVAREGLGEQTNFHTIVPFQQSLDRYDRVVVRDFHNFMEDAVPAEMVKYLNDEMVSEITRRNLFRQVVRATDEAERREKEPATLILDGYLDNYNSGSRGLRVPEIGLNHADVGIRIELHDGESGAMVGSAGISVYERGAARTARSAIDRAVKAAANFIAPPARP